MAKKNLEAERFIHHAQNYLTTTFKDEISAFSSDELKEKIVTYMIFAVQNGFESQADVMTLIDFVFRLPADFHSNPDFNWVSEILNDKTLDCAMKIETLHTAYAVFSAQNMS